jgi:hypothetical protein
MSLIVRYPPASAPTARGSGLLALPLQLVLLAEVRLPRSVEGRHLPERSVIPRDAQAVSNCVQLAQMAAEGEAVHVVLVGVEAVSQGPQLKNSGIAR